MLKNNDFERIIEESKMKIEELKLPIFEYKLSSMVDKSSDIKKPSELATFIEHTALKPETNVNEIVLLCNQAIKYKFLGVCVNPVYVPIAKKELRGTDCLVVTVISFPLGMSLTDIKVAEVEKTLSLGADEIDMVMSIGLLKSKEYKSVFNDIRKVIEAAKNKPTKVIIETCFLTEEEKVIACLLSQRAGAAYIKTSTGFGISGASVEDVSLIRNVVGNKIGIKAAGGIRDFSTAKSMIMAGANRLGCSSSINIIKEES